MEVLKWIEKIPEGYSEGVYLKAKYGITKSVFNNHKSYKIYAKELKGNNFISLNYYITNNNKLLKPCEMSEQKVVHFIKNIVIIKNNK
jgi:hypothetical protein